MSENKYMSYPEALNHYFPGSMALNDFVNRSYTVLLREGFSPVNSIALVNTCRDELTYPLMEKIQKLWGSVFDLSSLGAMMSAGTYGLRAAVSHSPNLDGRERSIHFVFPHIALDGQGRPGYAERRGRHGESQACGALVALMEELKAGKKAPTPDPDDPEMSLLRQRLLPGLQGKPADLVELTRLAQRTACADLEYTLDKVIDPAASDYAILSGILIHGPSKRQEIWPETMYACIAGKKVEIKI